MKKYFYLIFLSYTFLSCSGDNVFVKTLSTLSGDGYWKEYANNPVISSGKDTWDGGALGSMTVAVVNDTMHMYYEAWGVRTENPSDPDEEYSSLQIGHAISLDGVHWKKDEASPVIPKGQIGEWDCMGTWDPFVIYEDGIYKMWYGGGISSTCDWGYAESVNGYEFVKKGRISNLGKVEDVHVVHDKATGKYFMYYWNRHFEPDALFVAQSEDETHFDFENASRIRIDGETYPGKYKFTHVIQENGIWYMFYSNFVRPRCSNATVRLAVSEDGLNWKSVNKNLISGMDGDITRITDNLYVMYYGPAGYFDHKGCDIRMAVRKGSLNDLIVKE